MQQALRGGGIGQGAQAGVGGLVAVAQRQKIEVRLSKARENLAADDGSNPTVTAALEKAVATTEAKLDALAGKDEAVS